MSNLVTNPNPCSTQKATLNGGYQDVRLDLSVDDAHDAATVLKTVLDLRSFGSLTLYVWAESQALEVTLKRLVGFAADDSAIWQDVVAAQTVSAASNADAPNPATEVVELWADGCREGTYGVFARRDGDTDAGVLHLFGTVKSGGANDHVAA